VGDLVDAGGHHLQPRSRLGDLAPQPAEQGIEILGPPGALPGGGSIS
jgi:hypothetical protein